MGALHLINKRTDAFLIERIGLHHLVGVPILLERNHGHLLVIRHVKCAFTFVVFASLEPVEPHVASVPLARNNAQLFDLVLALVGIMMQEGNYAQATIGADGLNLGWHGTLTALIYMASCDHICLARFEILRLRLGWVDPSWFVWVSIVSTEQVLGESGELVLTASTFVDLGVFARFAVATLIVLNGWQGHDIEFASSHTVLVSVNRSEADFTTKLLASCSESRKHQLAMVAPGGHKGNLPNLVATNDHFVKVVVS